MLQTAYEGYEPGFARSRAGTPYRLQYLGKVTWRLDVQEMDGTWLVVEDEMTLRRLTAWGREQRAAGEQKLVRELGIRVSGSKAYRVKALRSEAREIAWGTYYTEEGGIGTSFVDRVTYSVWADLDEEGLIEVWGDRWSFGLGGSESFIGGDGMETAEDVRKYVEGHFYDDPASVDMGVVEHLVELSQQARSVVTGLDGTG
ncbi:MAG: hypothetical protein MK085_09665 [Phycisphaerales bacterium]|nr:hypothetical protein [Phycisphaerales bacterium]